MTMGLNQLFIHVFHLIYIAIICLESSFFYVQILTPKKGIAHPRRKCFMLSLALPAFLFFREKMTTKIATALLLLLSCSFAELSSMTLLSTINLFIPQIDLIPAHILLSAKLFPSFAIYAIDALIYLLFLFILSKSLKKYLFIYGILFRSKFICQEYGPHSAAFHQ